MKTVDNSMENLYGIFGMETTTLFHTARTVVLYPSNRIVCPLVKSFISKLRTGVSISVP